MKKFVRPETSGELSENHSHFKCNYLEVNEDLEVSGTLVKGTIAGCIFQNPISPQIMSKFPTPTQKV